MKPDRVWHVVFNTGCARILRRLPGPHEGPVPEITLRSPGLHLRDHLRDRPTRSFAAAGGGRRSAVEPGSDPVAEDARVFLRILVEFLEAERQGEAFDGLVLIASPDAIGVWRRQAGAALQALVRREFVRNLVSHDATRLAAELRRLEEKEPE